MTVRPERIRPATLAWLCAATWTAFWAAAGSPWWVVTAYAVALVVGAGAAYRWVRGQLDPLMDVAMTGIGWACAGAFVWVVTVLAVWAPVLVVMGFTTDDPAIPTPVEVAAVVAGLAVAVAVVGRRYCAALRSIVAFLPRTPREDHP